MDVFFVSFNTAVQRVQMTNAKNLQTRRIAARIPFLSLIAKINVARPTVEILLFKIQIVTGVKKNVMMGTKVMKMRVQMTVKKQDVATI